MKLKNKIRLAPVIFAVLALILIVFEVWPLLSGIKKNSEEIIFQKGKILELKSKIENLKSFQNLAKSEESPLGKIDKLLFNPQEPLKFIEFLEKNASDSRLSLKISPGTSGKIKTDPWPSLAFQLNLTGPFPNFLKFLERLEQSSYLIEILNLNIAKIAEKELEKEEFAGVSKGDIKANLSIKVYTK